MHPTCSRVSLRTRRAALPWLFGLCATLPAFAAPIGTLPLDGIVERPVRFEALTGARIVVTAERVIERGTLVIRDGRVVSVQAGTQVPAGAVARDMGGRTLFPGFIDLAASVGVPADMRAGGIKADAVPGSALDQQAAQPGPRHWNRRVRPEWSVAERLELKADEVSALRGLGFTTALAAPAAGVFGGRSALLSLRDGAARDVVLQRDVAQHLAFDFAYGSEYPGSLMGAIALIRQTLLDARWQAAQGGARREANLALDALAPVVHGRQPVLFRLGDELDVARAARIGAEFSLDLVLLGSGYEYRVLDAVQRAKAPAVLPLVFPDAPAVEQPDVALDTGLAELEHWRHAPANPARLAQAGVPVALTSAGLDAPARQFWPELRRAVAAGLSDTAALDALTRTPARILGAADTLGTLEPGRLANIVVADADLFRRAGAEVHEVWVEGQRHVLKPHDAPVVAGDWSLQWLDGQGPAALSAAVKGEVVEFTAGTVVFKGRPESGQWVALAPNSLFGAGEGQARLALRVQGDTLVGFRELPDGRRLAVSGTRSKAAAADAATAEAADAPIPAWSGYPAGEFRRSGAPAQPARVLFRGATVWTGEAAPAVADVLVRRGRIEAVGAGLSVPKDAEVIDAAGLHLTPGLIDAHSHTAIARNVNEPSHAVTAEVRIGDVLDPSDINLYRQLASGVTSANLLHGSANPMGGQSQTIKLRWGSDAEGLKFEGSKPGIKFALGENVKQSNWGDANRTRYPQTRMGVEQILRDRFNAARAYGEALAGNGAKPRRDLRLDTLWEILRGERLIHIHSYRHDEILMFARLAKDYGLPVGTFQHVLEGYKVADAIRDIGAGASTFTDWWAYKMEVEDAIPFNAALMTRVGVVTSLNSDSNELARRLNTEAAKAVKYGGLDEVEALKLVTLNPARQLGIEHRVGAIRTGLDADLVLWSAHPLSGYARVEQTWIDGRRYFDRAAHARDEAAALQARETLLQQALAERAKARALHVEAATASPPPAEPAEQVPPAGTATPDLLRRHAAARGLYHDGEDVVGCTDHGHGH